ncbi:hypothetical protein BDZ94DRAFT_1272121 [Collybia nuda]|uniref:DUF6534 domain-containing protein n=1 Tax=Collybia nuda TaxID=64659 RepID=A0A9P5XYB5_9AGAR|nr:hypothetical protein BDZ94DRAFT_1272121 [Collybia nuda]
MQFSMAEYVTMTSNEFREVTYLLGPWLVGSSLDMLLQGILFCQFTTYFTWHHNDTSNMRTAVVGLAFLTTIKSAQAFFLVWNIFIYHFKDVKGAVLANYTAWWETGNALMVANIGLYVQIFFCHRLWNLSSKNNWFVVPIATILLFGYVSVCFATYYISEGSRASSMIVAWFAAHFSSVFVGDMLITLGTAYFLIKTRQEVLPQTVGMINSLIRLTFQTAAPAAICAMFNLMLTQIYTGSENLVAVGLNQLLPKLYAVSMMWTLNARRGMRLNRGQILDSTSIHMRNDGNVELGIYNEPVRVHTQTEITRHIDSHSGDDIKTHQEFKVDG